MRGAASSACGGAALCLCRGEVASCLCGGGGVLSVWRGAAASSYRGRGLPGRAGAGDDGVYSPCGGLGCQPVRWEATSSPCRGTPPRTEDASIPHQGRAGTHPAQKAPSIRRTGRRSPASGGRPHPPAESASIAHPPRRPTAGRAPARSPSSAPPRKRVPDHPSGPANVLPVAASTTHRDRHAPVAQGIEQRPPEPCAQVRILPGAPNMRCPKTPSPAETLRPGSSRMCRRVRPGAGVCRDLWTRRGRDLGASPQVRPWKARGPWTRCRSLDLQLRVTPPSVGGGHWLSSLGESRGANAAR